MTDPMPRLPDSTARRERLAACARSPFPAVRDWALAQGAVAPASLPPQPVDFDALLDADDRRAAALLRCWEPSLDRLDPVQRADLRLMATARCIGAGPELRFLLDELLRRLGSASPESAAARESAARRSSASPPVEALLPGSSPSVAILSLMMLTIVLGILYLGSASTGTKLGQARPEGTIIEHGPASRMSCEDRDSPLP